MTTDLIGWIESACEQLESIADLPLLEAQLLAAQVFQKPRTWVAAHGELSLSAELASQLDLILNQRLLGAPLPYLLGSWEFFGRRFIVNPAVLIPRPETELLVNEGLRWLTNHPTRRTAADIGTGTGCIAISLACEIPALVITAVDSSQPALAVATQNAVMLGCANQIQFLQADLLKGLSAPVDLLAANLPYIPSDMLSQLPVARHEPLSALDGGPDGLGLIRRLLIEAPALINPGGLILLEIEANQGDSVTALAQKAFPQAQVNLIFDFNDLPRLVRIQLS
jgi:release factor glutamine methyltransferase